MSVYKFTYAWVYPHLSPPTRLFDEDSISDSIFVYCHTCYSVLIYFTTIRRKAKDRWRELRSYNAVANWLVHVDRVEDMACSPSKWLVGILAKEMEGPGCKVRGRTSACIRLLEPILHDRTEIRACTCNTLHVYSGERVGFMGFIIFNNTRHRLEHIAISGRHCSRAKGRWF